MNENISVNITDDENLFKDLKLSEIDIAWLAGLLEGEGSFSLDSRAKQRYEESTASPSPILRLSMTDKDVVYKVAKMLDKDSFEAGEKTKGNKTEYIVSSQSRPVLFYLLPRLLPYFGERRSIKVQKCIDALNDCKVWYLEGGRSKAARKGYEKGIGKKNKKN